MFVGLICSEEIVTKELMLDWPKEHHITAVQWNIWKFAVFGRFNQCTCNIQLVNLIGTWWEIIHLGEGHWKNVWYFCYWHGSLNCRYLPISVGVRYRIRHLFPMAKKLHGLIVVSPMSFMMFHRFIHQLFSRRQYVTWGKYVLPISSSSDCLLS